MIKVLLSFLFALVLLTTQAGEVPLGDFERANQLYKQDSTQQALTIYEQLIAKGWESAALYFNTGNCHYKLGSIAPAILFYEKALKLNPTDPDIQANLALAQSKTVDRSEQVPPAFFVIWWKSLVQWLSPDTWAWIAVLFMLCGTLTLGYYWFFSSGRNWLLVNLSIGIVVLSLFCAGIGTQAKHMITAQDSGIIFPASVTVRSAPDEGATQLFILHEGAKADILEDREGWKKISISESKVGWVMDQDIQSI